MCIMRFPALFPVLTWSLVGLSSRLSITARCTVGPTWGSGQRSVSHSPVRWITHTLRWKEVYDSKLRNHARCSTLYMNTYYPLLATQPLRIFKSILNPWFSNHLADHQRLKYTYDDVIRSSILSPHLLPLTWGAIVSSSSFGQVRNDRLILNTDEYEQNSETITSRASERRGGAQ